MGKSVRERLNRTIERDKREISEFNSKMTESKELQLGMECSSAEVNLKNDNKIIDNDEVDHDEVDDDIENIINLDVKEEVNDNDEYIQSNFKYKKIIIGLLVSIISLSIILVLWSNGYNIVNFLFNKLDGKDKDNKTNIKNENTMVVAIDLKSYYEKIHHMSNTIIIAEDGNIWGESEITLEAIEEIILKIEKEDEYISSELSKWLELDFSNAVEVHNYVWSKLGGTVGKAEKLNEKNIEILMSVLSE